ncbi:MULTISPECIES: CoA-binding protein [unclassified Crossiella]|uniref:CoA-binding protein n=1 Tax=unclassified Crossiella TaxID=2620835 RepID=UPI001FFE6D0F|nr:MULTISPECIES: CoA-binding protein [unclassified Crossiella]MCK2237112.1 CoA-binding protein [Crossiella sp. S99.2]MCK2250780.1 CoA-binding protein [Crossiella sp. S99.1]
MHPQWQDPEVIARLVRTARTVAVVGVSARPDRPSHQIAHYLHRQGLQVFPVNPALHEVFGLQVYPDLAAVPEHIDIVDVFRRSEVVAPVAEQAIEVKAGALWLQLGIEDEASCAKAAAAGLDVVVNRCLMVDHRNLAG